jgi:hypothetical protein
MNIFLKSLQYLFNRNNLKYRFYKVSVVFISAFFILNSVNVNAQTTPPPPTFHIINFNSSLTYFPGGSVSVLFEPKGVFSLDTVFKLDLSEHLESDFDCLVALEKKSFEIKSLGLKVNSERNFVINSSDLNKTIIHFLGASRFYLKIKLMRYVG